MCHLRARHRHSLIKSSFMYPNHVRTSITFRGEEKQRQPFSNYAIKTLPPDMSIEVNTHHCMSKLKGLNLRHRYVLLSRDGHWWYTTWWNYMAGSIGYMATWVPYAFSNSKLTPTIKSRWPEKLCKNRHKY